MADEGRGLVYAAGTLSPHIAEIDLATGQIARTFELDLVGYNSKFLKVNPVTRRLYVLIIETSRFFWVDLDTGQASPGQTLEHTGGMVVDTGTDRVLVRFPEEIVVFDGELNEIERHALGTAAGVALEVDEDSRWLYTLGRSGASSGASQGSRA